MNDILQNLNPAQREAVTTTKSAVLVLSGAGTGKTTVLTRRFAYLLSTNPDLRPWNILALTFTNKAAKEMKERISNGQKDKRTDGQEQNKMSICPSVHLSFDWIGTFHGICLKILRREYRILGRNYDFLIFGEDEQKKVLKTVFETLNLDKDKYDAGNWAEHISFFKDTRRRSGNENFMVILEAYNAELARLNAMDFGDLIGKTLELFKSEPKVLEKYRSQFKHILVDEFQDTNNIQYEFITQLTAGGAHSFFVGDDDQSIYSWRGAELNNILAFGKNPTVIIIVDTNYRSTNNILGAANSLIRHNSGRLGKDKELKSELGSGEPVRVRVLDSDYAEAEFIANAITRDKNKKLSDFAILIRAGSLSKKFEDEFIKRGIAYRLVGAQKFYDRAEIKDSIAYIRLLAHNFDDLSFLRIIGKPRRGFGDKAIGELRKFAAMRGLPLFAALREFPLKPKQRAAADEFLKAFDFEWDARTPSDAARQVLENSGYIKMWTDAADDDTAEDRVKNIYELISGTIEKYDSLDEFLENASLMVADDGAEDRQIEDTDSVSIMTIHAAKGLEFDTVFLPAWEEGIFPNERSKNDPSAGGGGLEEERRLAYVAITRAKRRCVITRALSRMLYGDWKKNNPSRFIGEIDDRFVQGDEDARSTCPPRREGAVARGDWGGAEFNCKSPPSPLSRTAHSLRGGHASRVVGKMVSHSEFGRGVVIEESGAAGGDQILTIAFRDRGIKKIASRFLVKE
ncbi:MAG: UvrD-helicase domain-containing protein [Rickettsiales bacterium]|jgi:DNA helicase-2/ATP-dependent DNA helicase PcrA|nr:UvrD-helicase domain-containing protein [Rickettsiales bacterium]